MKLIDITRSHSEMVNEQLANTDANFVKVYSLGQTTVIYTGAPTHQDIIILNKHRRIQQKEIDFVANRLFKDQSDFEIIRCDYFVELSISTEEQRPVFAK